ncbi:cell wall-binding repeat-containing protein [Microbacterium sp. 1P10UB]|uniref:cell wall-binding repeat-containing protein n=1 Tax=unclassified Microbacterium TaxID=2609290 RepID=UPI0039A023F3
MAAVPAPAFAADEPAEDSRAGYRETSEATAAPEISAAATAGVTAYVQYNDYGALRPAEGITVSMWRFSDESGFFEPVAVSGDPISGGRFSADVAEAGRYAIQFTADPYSPVGSEYYSDARYFFERTDVVIGENEVKDLGTVTLEPRVFDVWRLAGPDRFATAVAISNWIIADEYRAPVVYVANGYKFPDALAAGPAATLGGGVFLPTAPDYLPGSISEELRRLNPLRVVIVGDANSVSDAVVTSIRNTVGTGAVVDRIGGATRYETASLIVQDAFGSIGSPYAIVATGANFPDALAAGPAAGYMGAPVLLVNGVGRLDDATRSLLSGLGVTKVVVAGGPTTVSLGLEGDLQQALGADNVIRLAGVDRYETAGLINDWVFGDTDFTVLANGYGFIDALAGGPLAGALRAPLYLSDTNCLPWPTVDGLLVRRASGAVVLGSEATLSRNVAELGSC